MSLLDDVRAAYCSCDASEGNHGDSCIETLKSRIVAALEAAEKVERDLAWLRASVMNNVNVCDACANEIARANSWADERTPA